MENWRFITKPFRRHFTRKVLVVGSASGGKTTLVKDLARTYNAPCSLNMLGNIKKSIMYEMTS